jgi:hypothetical protein
MRLPHLNARNWQFGLGNWPGHGLHSLGVELGLDSDGTINLPNNCFSCSSLGNICTELMQVRSRPI